jgi:hypothetical protein
MQLQGCFCRFFDNPVKRIARLLGYSRVITYTLSHESASSLKAVGAKAVGTVEPKEWSVPSRPRKSQEVYGQAKVKWEL